MKLKRNEEMGLKEEEEEWGFLKWVEEEEKAERD